MIASTLPTFLRLRSRTLVAATFFALAILPAGCFPAAPGDGSGAQADGGGSAGVDGGQATDGGATPPASLRITEVNPAGHSELIELVAVSGGTLGGITIDELTNSGFSYTFPAGYTLADMDVIVLHVGGGCTDVAGDRTSCGNTAPFTRSAWDLSAPGALTYSGKVFEVFAPDGSPMDGVPFVKSHGVMPTSVAAAVQQLQSDRVWAATPACVDDPNSIYAKDRYCRNIAVAWDNMLTDYSNSVMRIAGPSPLDVPGSASEWSAALPSTWGSY